MYACAPLVDSGKPVSSLPTCMYPLPNLLATPGASDKLTAGEEFAAAEIDICRLELLRGELYTLARIQSLFKGAPAAAAAASDVAKSASVAAASVKSSAISKAPPPKPSPAAAASSKPSNASAAVNRQAQAAAAASPAPAVTPSPSPLTLSLQCSPSRPPIAVLLLVELLRSRQGVAVYLGSHCRVSNGVVASLSPALNRLLTRLTSANPPRRMSADVCLDLIWSVGDCFANDCCLIGDVFSGQPLLGELLALRYLNLMGIVKRQLPVDEQLLDLADHLQTGRRVPEQRLADLLGKSESDSTDPSLGKLLAWSVLLFSNSALASGNQQLGSAIKKFLTKLNAEEPFCGFYRDLTAK